MKKRYARPVVKKLTRAELGRHLRELRARIGSPVAVGRLLGLDREAIAKFERGREVPPWYLLALGALARSTSTSIGRRAS